MLWIMLWNTTFGEFFGASIALWLLWNLAVAVLVGALARYIVPGREQMGWFTTIVIGFVGGILANFVAHIAGWVPWGKNTGILGSLAGAVVLVLAFRVWKFFKKPRTKTSPGTVAKP